MGLISSQSAWKIQRDGAVWVVRRGRETLNAAGRVSELTYRFRSSNDAVHALDRWKIEQLPPTLRPTCGICGRSDVRVYRAAESPRRPETDRCNECIGWARVEMIPCVLDSRGVPLGYLDVSEAEYDAFAALPEASGSHPQWMKDESCWSMVWTERSRYG